MSDTSGASCKAWILAALAALLVAAPGPAGAQAVRDCPDCPELVELPDGSAIGRHPVTRGEFAAFARETGFKGEGCYQGAGAKWSLAEKADWRSPGFAQTDVHPVVCVSWLDAIAYTDWLSEKTGEAYRLPTLEEAVAAASTDSAQEFWWGDDASDICRYANVADQTYREAHPDDDRTTANCSDGFSETAPVGSFLPNAQGLHDMSGNVWQWTNTCPQGDCSQAVFRGGGWNDVPTNEFRLGHHWADRAEVRSFALGFRVLRSKR